MMYEPNIHPGLSTREAHEVSHAMRALETKTRPLSLRPEDAGARADMYRFLSAVYLRPPQPELLRCMTEGDLLEQLSRLLGSGGDAHLESLRSCAPDRDDPAPLEQEYMDLFAVPTGRYVFPFEDVYRGTPAEETAKRGPLLGQCAVSVKRLYRQAGAQIDPACTELPTHIGIELSFMSFLCQMEAETHLETLANAPQPRPTDGNDKPGWLRELQLRFLTEHLNEWFPDLSRSIQANATSKFYPTLALFTEQFLSWDTEDLLDNESPGGA